MIYCPLYQVYSRFTLDHAYGLAAFGGGSLGAFGGAAGTAASGNAEERAFVRVMSPPHPPQGGLSPHPPQGGAPQGELLCFVRKKRSALKRERFLHRSQGGARSSYLHRGRHGHHWCALQSDFSPFGIYIIAHKRNFVKPIFSLREKNRCGRLWWRPRFSLSVRSPLN